MKFIAASLLLSSVFVAQASALDTSSAATRILKKGKAPKASKAPGGKGGKGGKGTKAPPTYAASLLSDGANSPDCFLIEEFPNLPQVGTNGGKCISQDIGFYVKPEVTPDGDKEDALCCSKDLLKISALMDECRLITNTAPPPNGLSSAIAACSGTTGSGVHQTRVFVSDKDGSDPTVSFCCDVLEDISGDGPINAGGGGGSF